MTATVYEAGYSAPSRFYADSEARRGMAPGQWRRGGDGVAIGWTMVTTPLGTMLIALTARGPARLAFDENEAMLAGHFSTARITPLAEGEAAAIAHMVTALPLPDPALIEAVTQGLTGQRAERQL